MGISEYRHQDGMDLSMNREVSIDSIVQLSTDFDRQKLTLNKVTNSLGNFINAGILKHVDQSVPLKNDEGHTTMQLKGIHYRYIVRAMPEKIVGWNDNSI